MREQIRRFDGPWVIEDLRGTQFIGPPRADGKTSRIVVSMEDYTEFKDTAKVYSLQDAQLISQAPELYWCLRNLMNGIETCMVTIDSVADETLGKVLMRGFKAIAAVENPVGLEASQ